MKNETKLCQGKLVVDTDLVKIFFTGTEHRVFIKMSQGGTVEHEPLPGSLEGLVTALQLATEICAGKFFLKRVVEVHSDAPRIEKQTLQLGGGK